MRSHSVGWSDAGWPPKRNETTKNEDRARTLIGIKPHKECVTPGMSSRKGAASGLPIEGSQILNKAEKSRSAGCATILAANGGLHP